MLRISAAQRGNHNNGGEAVAVTLDGASLGTITPTGISYADYTLGPFTTTAGSHTLAFTGVDPSGLDNTAFIDNVRLSPSNYGSTYSYTGDGLRAVKKDSFGNRTYFLYDGSDPVCESNSTGTVTAVNTFGANGLLSRHSTASGSAFYTYDFQGDVEQRLDSSANILSSFAYEAWGNWQSSGNSPADPFTFGGQWGYYSDADTGLVLCTHRYYDLSVGRWLTRDPMGYGGGVNLYEYCSNSPVDRTDPSGFASKAQCAAIYKRIQNIMRDLQRKIDKYDPVLDGQGGFPIYKGGVFRGRTQPGSHYKAIKDLQDALKEAVLKYNQECRHNNNDGNPKTPQCGRQLLYNPAPPVYPVTTPRRYPPTRIMPRSEPEPIPEPEPIFPEGFPIFEFYLQSVEAARKYGFINIDYSKGELIKGRSNE